MKEFLFRENITGTNVVVVVVSGVVRVTDRRSGKKDNHNKITNKNEQNKFSESVMQI